MNIIHCPNCGRSARLYKEYKKSLDLEKITIICDDCKIHWKIVQLDYEEEKRKDAVRASHY